MLARQTTRRNAESKPLVRLPSFAQFEQGKLLVNADQLLAWAADFSFKNGERVSLFADEIGVVVYALAIAAATPSVSREEAVEYALRTASADRRELLRRLALEVLA